MSENTNPSVGSTTNQPPSLLDAARALLEARENQMVTAVEWDRLREAVAAAERDR
jgi:hypothetical protein